MNKIIDLLELCVDVSDDVNFNVTVYPSGDSVYIEQIEFINGGEDFKVVDTTLSSTANEGIEYLIEWVKDKVELYNNCT